MQTFWTPHKRKHHTGSDSEAENRRKRKQGKSKSKVDGQHQRRNGANLLRLRAIDKQRRKVEVHHYQPAWSSRHMYEDKEDKGSEVLS